MKIDFPKIVREFDLEEYAPEWHGQKISVWVNPPSNTLIALGDFYKAYIDQREIPGAIKTVKEHLASIEEPTKEQAAEHEKLLAMYEQRLEDVSDEKYKDAYEDYLKILSSFLSQSSDPEKHITVDDLRDIEKVTSETDPAFWVWLQTRVVNEVNDYRLGRKKV